MKSLKNDKVWDLPKPAKTPDGKSWIFSEIPRKGSFIPWGYDLNPNDTSILTPNIEQLETLEEAKKHLRRYSYRKVADWLTAKTGRKITAQGLKYRLDREYRLKGAIAWADFQRKKAQEYAEKAEALARRTIGPAGEIDLKGGSGS